MGAKPAETFSRAAIAAKKRVGAHFRLTHCGIYFMVAAMKSIWRHKRQPMPVRIFCLVLMAALSANSLLAAVNTVPDCNPQRCCLDGSANTPAAFKAEGVRLSCCCDPGKAIPCHMSAAPLANAPLAIVPASTGSILAPNPALLKESHPVTLPNSTRPPLAGDLLDAAHSPPALYLQTCRLIC